MLAWLNSGTTFVLAILGWLLLALTVAIAVGRMIREGERDLRSLEEFDRARNVLGRWPSS